ncbi:MAG: hypothetical protein IH966_07665 [Gemmatimonadetes bacterium]|nr:hypothetical protein [Gemmatimonadota bacterium]
MARWKRPSSRKASIAVAVWIVDATISGGHGPSVETEWITRRRAVVRSFYAAHFAHFSAYEVLLNKGPDAVNEMQRLAERIQYYVANPPRSSTSPYTSTSAQAVAPPPPDPEREIRGVPTWRPLAAPLSTGDINAMPLLESDGRTVKFRLRIADWQMPSLPLMRRCLSASVRLCPLAPL